MSIPPALAANVGIYAGSKVAITTEKGKMVLSPIPESSSKASGTGLVRKNFIQPKRSK
jgi:virulence-associated protein VagC